MKNMHTPESEISLHHCSIRPEEYSNSSNKTRPLASLRLSELPEADRSQEAQHHPKHGAHPRKACNHSPAATTALKLVIGKASRTTDDDTDDDFGGHWGIKKHTRKRGVFLASGV